MVPITEPKKVSIVVPCYNVERYLPACLDSLLAQTLDGIEVVCVDDGSTDGTLAILHEYEAAHPDVVTVIGKENGGAWRARRAGIAEARGAYIGFVDGDDTVEPDFCEKLYGCITENGADIAVCGFRRVDEVSGSELSRELVAPREAIDVAQSPERLLELNTAPWNKLFAADLVKKMPDLQSPPPIFEDVMMHLLIYPRVSHIAFVGEPLVRYSVREGSLMTSIDANRVEATYDALCEVKAIYRVEEVSPTLLDVLDAAAFVHLGVSLPFRLASDDTADLGTFLKGNRAFLDESFPAWRTNRVISLAHARAQGGALAKAWMARSLYKAHMMRPALAAYRFTIEKLGIDIKW